MGGNPNSFYVTLFSNCSIKAYPNTNVAFRLNRHTR